MSLPVQANMDSGAAPSLGAMLIPPHHAARERVRRSESALPGRRSHDSLPGRRIHDSLPGRRSHDALTRRRPSPDETHQFVSRSDVPGAPWRERHAPRDRFFSPDNDDGTAFAPLPAAATAEPERSPSPPTEERPRRRASRSTYDAMETHGSFGLLDTHRTTGGYRALVAHIPRSSRTYTFDMRVGDTVHCNAVVGGVAVGGRLTVGFITPHKYYRPGVRVTECVIGVPEDEWVVFEQAV